MATTAAPATGATSAPSRLALLEIHPELALHIDPEHREQARGALTVPALTVGSGRWHQGAITETGRRAFGAIVASGLVCRTLHIGGHPAIELYGPGDVIAGEMLHSTVLAAEATWRASTTAQLAILDDEFLHAVRRWPRLVTGLSDMLLQQHDRLALHMVIAAQPRVEDRLIALFRLLSERYGRVAAAGVIVDVALTHEAIGRLIGAQRPTVSLALKSLRAQDVMRRLPGGRWLLAVDATTPPRRPAVPEARFSAPSALRTGTPSGT